MPGTDGHSRWEGIGQKCLSVVETPTPQTPAPIPSSGNLKEHLLGNSKSCLAGKKHLESSIYQVFLLPSLHLTSSIYLPEVLQVPN